MEQIFTLCVHLLEWMGRITGLGYVNVNVWIFCVFEPLLFMVLAARWIIVERRLRRFLSARVVRPIIHSNEFPDPRIIEIKIIKTIARNMAAEGVLQTPLDKLLKRYRSEISQELLAGLIEHNFLLFNDEEDEKGDIVITAKMLCVHPKSFPAKNKVKEFVVAGNKFGVLTTT